MHFVILDCSAVYSSQEQPACPSTEEGIKKMCYIPMMEYYSAMKKDEIMPFAATQMGREDVILSEISQK